LPRACSFAGCPRGAVSKGLCQRHLSARIPRSVAYGSAHRELRLEAFWRDGFTCKKCGFRPDWAERIDALKAAGIPIHPDRVQKLCAADYNAGRQHLQGDHIMPVEQAPHLAHVLSNYQTLCNKCNTKGRT
jgi:5-methylcytosine-specific restriction endonuclease McrA